MSEPMSATLPGETTTESEVCPQCGNPADWNASSWCGTCGYYPAIGRLIEAPPIESEETVYENWWEAIPNWLWIFAGGIVAIFVASVAVRLVFDESPVRMWWTAAQLLCGAMVFMVAHLMAYLHAASRSDRIGPLDALMKPIATWQPVLRSLPNQLKLLCAGGWSLTAVVLAFLVIDGIDYQALADASKNAEESKKRTNPMAAVIKSAQTIASAQDKLPRSGGNADSLEDALSEFTGADGTDSELANLSESALGEAHGALLDGVTAGEFNGEDGEHPSDDTMVSDSQTLDGESKRPSSLSAAESEKLRESIQCVVIGYTTNNSGDPRSLLLAAVLRERLQFVAKVPLDRVDELAKADMQDVLQNLHHPRPITASPFGGRWLRPELLCEVRFSGWTPNGRLSDAFVTEIARLPQQKQAPFDSAVTAP